jgi:hypothetical protein
VGAGRLLLRGRRASALSASLLLARRAAFSAGLLNVLTAFGFAMIEAPLLLLIYDLKSVVALQSSSRSRWAQWGWAL